MPSGTVESKRLPYSKVSSLIVYPYFAHTDHQLKASVSTITNVYLHG